MRQVFWFAVAGTIGFVADASMLWLLNDRLGIGPFLARAFAIAFAMTITWIFNRTVTFGKSRFPAVLEGIRYGTVGFGSAAFNYLIYAGLLLVAPHLDPLIALVIASIAAMAVSWTGYSRFVFIK